MIIVPLSDVAHFPDFEVIARDRNLAALVGDTTPLRSRDAYDSEDSFLDAISLGFADRYTFDNLAEATTFAEAKLKDLARAAEPIEDSMKADGNTTT